MKRRRLILSSLILSLSVASSAAAAPIDAWEPLNSGTAVPSVAEGSIRTGSAWMGYSDGSVYLTTDASSATPVWMRMDKGTSMGQPFDMGLTTPITAIAVADSYDEYVAYVGVYSPSGYSRILRCIYGRSGIVWTELSAASVSELEGLSINPLERGRLYAASSNGIRYSTDYGETWTSTVFTDPLTPPSGTAISAIGAGMQSRGDWIVVGGVNGELWSVVGARGGAAQWTRLDEGASAGLRDRAVTRIQVDDTTNPPAILAVFGGSSEKSVWIKKGNEAAFVAARNPAVSRGEAAPTVLSASFSPLREDSTLYAQIVGAGIRSDDGGRNWFRTPRWSEKSTLLILGNKTKEISALCHLDPHARDERGGLLQVPRRTPNRASLLHLPGL